LSKLHSAFPGNENCSGVTVNLATQAGPGYALHMSNFVIQLHRSEYHDFVGYLTGMRFERIVLNVPAVRFKTALQLTRLYVSGACRLLKHLGTLREADTLVVFSHFAFVVKLLARLGLVHYDRLFCFGFFLHDPRWFPICRLLVWLDRSQDHYVIFSEAEKDLYATQLGIARVRMHFVPLGDWAEVRLRTRKNSALKSATATKADFYFAGGRSNRDYVPLVEAFRSISAKLVIVCSDSNWEELKELSLPENVRVLCDLPVGAFDDYLRSAKAGIIPLKRDMGSSGQSVALALMRNAKCVLATDAAGLREYVEHGVSGFLVTDMRDEIPALVEFLEADPGRAEAMGRAARERYEQHFSLTVAAEAFENVLAETHLESAA
jgi:glycosyltransferase involved in cell wall biosynthesis